MKKEKPQIIQKTGKFFYDCKSELKKIVWPDVKSVFKSTGVVLTSIVISSIFVGLLDFGLTQLLSTIMSIAK